MGPLSKVSVGQNFLGGAEGGVLGDLVWATGRQRFSSGLGSCWWRGGGGLDPFWPVGVDRGISLSEASSRPLAKVPPPLPHQPAGLCLKSVLGEGAGSQPLLGPFSSPQGMPCTELSPQVLHSRSGFLPRKDFPSVGGQSMLSERVGSPRVCSSPQLGDDSPLPGQQSPPQLH